MNRQLPKLGHPLIARKTLWDRIDAAVQGSVLFVHAPAGYGKTCLLAQWATESQQHRKSVRWITLSAAEADEKTFLIRFAVAVGSDDARRKIFAEFENLTIDGLHRLIIERLQSSAERQVIVLDDYHLVDVQPINKYIGQLSSSSAFNLHCLVVLSRTRPSIPVGRLWIDGQLTSLNASNLIMSEAEVGGMLALISPDLPESSLQSVFQKTEGWAVAVRMAGLLVENNATRIDPLAGFSGHQVDVAHYLAEHLVSDLSNGDMHFLMLLSPLNSFSIELAEHLTGVSDAAERLAGLERVGVPITYLGDDQTWVRLHPVFQDFLRARQFPDGFSTIDIVRSAANWFETKSDTEHSVEHALMADDFVLAASILERAGGWRLLYAGAGKIRQVLPRLFSSQSQISHARFPRTWLGYVVMLAKDGELLSANEEFSRLNQQLQEHNAELDRELRLIEQLLALYHDIPATHSQTAKLEADLTALIHDPVQNALTLNILCFHCLQVSEFEKSLVFGSLAAREFQRTNAFFGEAHLNTHMGQAYFMQADIRSATEAYQNLRASARTLLGERSDLEAMAEALNAEVLVEKGELNSAEDELSRALPQLECGDCWFDILAAAYLAVIRIHLINKQYGEAHSVLDQAASVAVSRRYERLGQLVERERVYLLAVAGTPAEARALAENRNLTEVSATDRFANDLSRHLRGQVPALLWARIAHAEGHYDEALRYLALLRDMQVNPISNMRQLRLQVFEIRVLLSAGRVEAANAILDQLLLLSCFDGVHVSFLEEGDDVIDLLQQRQASASLSPVAVNQLNSILATHHSLQARLSDNKLLLTKREQSVLKLLDSGLSNKQIAGQLEVSNNTVKFHLKNIFQKLESNNRVNALAQARKLGILA